MVNEASNISEDNTNLNDADDSLNNNESSTSPGKDGAKKSVTGKIKSVIDERKSEERKQLESKVNELTEALQRERADITNIRRRHDEQMSGLRNIAKASVVRDLL